MPDAPSGLTRLERLLPTLGRLAGAELRVWRHEGPGFLPLGEGVWLEIRNGGRGAEDREAVAEVVRSLLAAERETADVAAELAGRYEEIDLIYTISEILGHTIRLDEAAQRILKEVSTVVRARRATLLVRDPERNVLRVAAAQGVDFQEAEPIEVDDPCSIAARVFRDMRIISFDPSEPGAANPGCPEGRQYKGRAFLSVPVTYAAPGGPPKPIGVINLTDRLGEDAFTAGDRKLVVAIANQIGAALENSRLVDRDRGQQRLRRELELARDLQLKLLPSPLVVAAKADVAARCRPAESVGGDFYNLLQLHGDRIGVMVGDVSSHGFGAALIMALAMATSGIHAETAATPGDVLARMEDSLADELARTEMFLTLFYAVIDPVRGALTYANAGHPQAFVVAASTGEATRLAATRPPLGLGVPAGADVSRPWRRRDEILCLFTDGLADALSERNERYGEDRLLGHVRALAQRPARDILEAVFTDVAAFTGGGDPSDDRTLVLLKV